MLVSLMSGCKCSFNSEFKLCV